MPAIVTTARDTRPAEQVTKLLVAEDGLEPALPVFNKSMWPVERFTRGIKIPINLDSS